MSSCKQATSLRLASHIPGILIPPHIPNCSTTQILILVACRFKRQQKQQTCTYITHCRTLELISNSHASEPLPSIQLSPKVPTTQLLDMIICIHLRQNDRRRHSISLGFRNQSFGTFNSFYSLYLASKRTPICDSTWQTLSQGVPWDASTTSIEKMVLE